MHVSTIFWGESRLCQHCLLGQGAQPRSWNQTNSHIPKTRLHLSSLFSHISVHFRLHLYLFYPSSIIIYIYFQSILFFLKMLLHVFCQSIWQNRCKLTLVAFVWFFPTVCFQMPLQIACLRRCKVTLVTFVWFFSTVRFQMRPQMACLRGCIVTLVAFVWLFSTVCFQMYP